MTFAALLSLLLVTGAPAAGASGAPLPAPPAPVPPAAPALAPAASRPAGIPSVPLPPDLAALVEIARQLHAELSPAPAPRAVVDGPDPEFAPRSMEDALVAAVRRLREVRTDTTFAAPRGATLEVSNFSGAIGVQAWRRNDVRVVVSHARRDRLRPAFANGVLTLAVVDRAGDPAFGDLTVFVPEWMPVRIQSVESPIDIEGLQAAIEAGSIQGDVIVRQVCGPMQLRSVEGLVRVLDARGAVNAASINNLVRLERVVGGIDAESVNGDIQMSDVESPDVDASSVNGTVEFQGPFRPRGRYRLVSHNGNLRVGVPVGSDVDVSVHNFRGAFQSGVPLRVAPHVAGRRFTFTLGGGGSSLELQSFQGFIQLMRSTDAPLPPRPPQPPESPAEEGHR